MNGRLTLLALSATLTAALTACSAGSVPAVTPTSTAKTTPGAVAPSASSPAVSSPAPTHSAGGAMDEAIDGMEDMADDVKNAAENMGKNIQNAMK